MFGYATDETPELMPAPIRYAHLLAQRLHQVRTQNIIRYVRPDGKTQVSIEYDSNGLVRVDTIVLSTQHHPDIFQDQLSIDIMTHVILPVM